jgi:hypothetical protein
MEIVLKDPQPGHAACPRCRGVGRRMAEPEARNLPFSDAEHFAITIDQERPERRTTVNCGFCGGAGQVPAYRAAAYRLVGTEAHAV